MPYTSFLSNARYPEPEEVYGNLSIGNITTPFNNEVFNEATLRDLMKRINKEEQEDLTKSTVSTDKIKERLTKLKVLSDNTIEQLLNFVFEKISQINQVIATRRPPISVYASLWNCSATIKEIGHYNYAKKTAIRSLMKNGHLSRTLETEISGSMDALINKFSEEVPLGRALNLRELLNDKQNLAYADSKYSGERDTCFSTFCTSPTKDFPENNVARFATEEEVSEFVSKFKPNGLLYIESMVVLADEPGYPVFPTGEEENLAYNRLSKFFSTLENEHLTLQQAATSILKFSRDFCNTCVAGKICQNVGTVFKCYKYAEVDRDLQNSLLRVGRGV